MRRERWEEKPVNRVKLSAERIRQNIRRRPAEEGKDKRQRAPKSHSMAENLSREHRCVKGLLCTPEAQARVYQRTKTRSKKGERNKVHHD